MEIKKVTTDNQDIEAKILQCAEREFMDKGYAGARTANIAEAAGVSKSALHYHFRSKEKLFERIINEKIEMLKEAIIPALYDVDRPLVIYIKNIIGHHLKFISANPHLPGFLIRELNSGSAQASTILNAIRGFSSTLLSVFGDKINRAVADGICEPVDIRMLIIDIVSLNVFPYMASPILNAALADCMANSEEFMEMRRKENLELILRRLKPRQV
ncbi:MAG: TetR/AcrR family transcriptional regulator [Paramuribaculum sp.]|nr:TetR/AcrR family transcriptional regulator [Paramuribaculum sp.]